MRTFRDALPADAARQIRNFNRRLRYRQTLDRPKVWAGDKVPNTPYAWGFRSLDNIQSHLQALLSGNTEAYVLAWSRLNHLKTDREVAQ